MKTGTGKGLTVAFLSAASFMAASPSWAADLWVETDNGAPTEAVLIDFDPESRTLQAGGFTYASDGGVWCFRGDATRQGVYSGQVQTTPPEGATEGLTYSMRMHLSVNPDYPDWLRIATSKYFWGKQGGWLRASDDAEAARSISQSCAQYGWAE